MWQATEGKSEVLYELRFVGQTCRIAYFYLAHRQTCGATNKRRAISRFRVQPRARRSSGYGRRI
jgi:hypothetical protein